MTNPILNESFFFDQHKYSITLHSSMILKNPIVIVEFATVKMSRIGKSLDESYYKYYTLLSGQLTMAKVGQSRFGQDNCQLYRFEEWDNEWLIIEKMFF